MTLEELNRGNAISFEADLLRCCGSKGWVAQLLKRRPFTSERALHESATSVWWALSASDWLEAFAAHPEIGRQSATRWSQEEQSGVESEDRDLQVRLACGNRDYQQKFGWIFLVNATGKTGGEMADSLEARLRNEPSDELRITAAEQEQIMNLRLEKLLSS